MKALLSILLGLMLLTSLVGISYATPMVQPTQNAGGNNSADNCGQQSQGSNWNYNVTVACHGDSHVGGSADPPQHGCVVVGQQADTRCCSTSITPQSLEFSDNHADIFQAVTVVVCG